MTPRHLSVLSLAILLTLFAVDRGGLISAATMVGGTAIGIRFWLWQAATGSAPTDHARQLLNAGMISVLWLACLSILTTSWFPADSFLPITLLASAWFILDKPSGRHVDTLFVAVNCLASWVIFNVVSLPDPYTIPAAGLVGALALAAFSLLDRQRVAALLGPERLSGGALGDPVALVLIAVITIPIACLAPISSPTTASPVEWSQGLGRIVGFTDSVDLTGLGLLKTNDSPALNVRVWDVVEKTTGERDWLSVSQWKNDGESQPDRHSLLLRGAALGKWDGSTFTSFAATSPEGAALRPEALDDALGFSLVRQQIESGPHGGDTLFALERPIGGTQNVRLSSAGLRAVAPVDHEIHYRVVSKILPPSHRHRLKGRRAFHVDSRYRDTGHVSATIQRVAREVAAASGTSDTYERVAFIQGWFTEREDGGDFEYTRFNRNAGADPIATFLVDTRAGHCAFFASAMVLMLRSLDIPARLAVGFRGGTWSDRAGAFRVLQKDAHAWVEVPFEGAGWIPFDPTPPESTLDLATTAGRASNLGLAGTAAPASANDAERAQTRPWQNPVLAIAAAGVVVLGAWVLRRRQARSSRGALRGPEAGLHARVVSIATRGGAKRRRSATLRELIGEAPTLPHRTLPELLRVVAWLYRARYGGRPLGAEESLEAGRILIAVERAIDP